MSATTVKETRSSDMGYSTKPPTERERMAFCGHIEEALFCGSGALAQVGISESMRVWLESMVRTQEALLRRARGRCSNDELAEFIAETVACMLQIFVAVGMERANGAMERAVLGLSARARGIAGVQRP